MNARMSVRAAIAALGLTVAGIVSSDEGKGSPLPAIVGPWRVAITPVDCDTGQEFSQFTFLSHLTFAAGGTLAETTSSLSFQPNQRSPGQGLWQHTGRQTYRAYFEAFVRFDSVDPVPPQRPYQRGIQSVDQSLQMTDRDHWTSDAVVLFRDTAGEIIPPSGCAIAAAERMR